jgi:hypothetical protein
MTPDDDRTMLVPTTQDRHATPCPPPVDHALPVGTHLAEFEVTGVLGAGGFGIVYLAYDRRLERHVALKEFMPAGFALRDADGRVHPCNEAAAEAFEIGLHSFVNEARLLAQFDAPSLLKVYRFWEEKGTAYMVMPYYRGRTLKQAVADSDALAEEATLRRLLDSILDALAILHAQQCYHRDIAPDNIMMLDDERPVLLDFGAARRAIGDMPQAFTTIFKQAYAPIEQISENAQQRQGPWTDLFALAGVLHYVIDGQPPPPAVGRTLTDAYVPLAQRYAHRYSPSLLQAIDSALAVRPQDRPQSVQQMRAMMGQTPTPTQVEPPVQAAPAPAAPRRWPLVAGAVLGLAAAAGLGVKLLAHQDDAGQPARQANAGATAPAPTPAAAVPAPAPAPVPARFDPVQAFAKVVAGADPDMAVEVSLPQPTLVVDRDPFKFTIHSRRAGYVYVHMLSSDSNLPQLIFPRASDSNNRIEAGQTLELPRKSLVANGPAGLDHFVAIVSERPRDFKAVGFEDGPSVSFPTLSIERMRAARLPAGLAAPLAGIAVCASTGPCEQRYGAAAFTIEEVAR